MRSQATATKIARASNVSCIYSPNRRYEAMNGCVGVSPT
jgi:hypothetical protein